MEEEDDDVDFVIEEFLENLDSVEEDAEASEDEVEEAEAKIQDDYQNEKVVRLKEENILLTNQLFCMDQKLEVLCRIMNIEKDNLEKEWEFYEQTLFQEEENDGKDHQILTEDSFLAKMYVLLIEKFPLGGKKPQEDLGCLVTGDLRSAGIIELKEAGESLSFKVVRDSEVSGMSENKVFDDLLFQIVEVEALFAMNLRMLKILRRLGFQQVLFFMKRGQSVQKRIPKARSLRGQIKAFWRRYS